MRASIVRLLPVAFATLLGTTGCDTPTLPDVDVQTVALRPDAPGADDIPPAFTASDRVEQLDSEGGEFRIHYTRAGVHAVPAQDSDDNGVPDYVEHVAREYDAILAYYRDTLGFAAPLPDAFMGDDGGDARFDVYLLDFATTADGAFRREGCLAEAPTRCTGYMVLENDFKARNYPSPEQAVRIVASHELFHAITAAYRADDSAILNEGSAVWASESYDPKLRDFESFIAGYLADPERSLGQEPTGPVDPYSYGSALFFRFLEEHIGRDLIRELWQAAQEDGGGQTPWLQLLDRILRTHESSLEDCYAQFTRWNLYTGPRADPTLAYREGATYAQLEEQAIALPFEDDLVRVFPLAARFYRGSSGTRTGSFGVAAVARDPASLQGVQLVLARELASRIVDMSSGDASAGPLTLELDGHDSTLHVAVLNTRLSGESARPALCVGDSDELQSCLERAHARAGTASSGAASNEDGEHSRDDSDAGNEASSKDSGCGVANGARLDDLLSPWIPLTLAVTLLRSRRRHRGTTASSHRAVTRR